MKNQKREGKMCPKYIKPYMVGDMNMAGMCVNRAMDESKCPKNTNSYCQIITPKKKKSGVVKVKGWAHYSEPHGFYSATDFKTCWNKVPCVITIKNSDIKRGKK